MASDERTGARVKATFILATGPKASVTGASTMPRAITLVSFRRLIPVGWNSHCE